MDVDDGAPRRVKLILHFDRTSIAPGEKRRRFNPSERRSAVPVEIDRREKTRRFAFSQESYG
jgi:hypothetical protein